MSSSIGPDQNQNPIIGGEQQVKATSPEQAQKLVAPPELSETPDSSQLEKSGNEPLLMKGDPTQLNLQSLGDNASAINISAELCDIFSEIQATIDEPAPQKPLDENINKEELKRTIQDLKTGKLLLTEIKNPEIRELILIKVLEKGKASLESVKDQPKFLELTIKALQNGKITIDQVKNPEIRKAINELIRDSRNKVQNPTVEFQQAKVKKESIRIAKISVFPKEPNVTEKHFYLRTKTRKVNWLNNLRLKMSSSKTYVPVRNPDGKEFYINISGLNDRKVIKNIKDSDIDKRLQLINDQLQILTPTKKTPDKLQWDERNPVGMGGFNKVYKAQKIDETKLLDGTTAIRTENVALRVLKPGFKKEIVDVETKGLKLHERCMNHNNVADIKQLTPGSENASELKTIMPFYEGGDGRDLLRKLDNKKTWDSKDIEAIHNVFIGLASGVAHIHEQNVIHRDIKLDNFMLDEEVHPKIVDFGLAKEQSEKNKGIAGTPSYLPPEALRREDPQQGKPGDVWAIGISMFNLIKGKGMKREKQTVSNLRKYAEKKCGGKLDPLLAHDLDCLEKIMKLKPEDRLTAEELSKELSNIKKR